MKSIMRLQKTQLVPLKIFSTAGFVGKFDPAPYLEAGYSTYDVFLVGAAGGRSGTAWGRDTNDRDYKSGGGGGGSLWLRGKLTEMIPGATDIVVGSPGVDGLDSTVNQGPAGNGTDGGQSSIKINGVVHAAYGGKGAIGADFNFTSTTMYSRRGEGGDGGGNTANLGSGGDGFIKYMGDVDGPGSPAVANTDGVWAAGGVAPVIGGGRGGGGGGGKIKEFGDLYDIAYSGATGATPTHYGYPNPGTTNFGGTGGGANIWPFQDGVLEENAAHYGSGGGFLEGVVCIRIS